jgi:16S rRNA (cytosine1402-N4)-methyltransferase
MRPAVQGAKPLVVDCTCGEGGHSELILETFSHIHLFAFDRDPDILNIARTRLSRFGERVTFVNSNFSGLAGHLGGHEGEIAAFLFDFGISSYHFDAAGRGFSYLDDSLDMRLEPGLERTAADLVNRLPEKDLADIIYLYGEERHSRRIARSICARRAKRPFETAQDLADLVGACVPRPPKHARGPQIHPATRTFQALRIAVNDELAAIERGLRDAWRMCAVGGRVLAISFHSLEDRIVKHTYRDLVRGCICGDGPVDACRCDREPRIRLAHKGALVPQDDEIAHNRRARSAKLRVCEKISSRELYR